MDVYDSQRRLNVRQENNSWLVFILPFHGSVDCDAPIQNCSLIHGLTIFLGFAFGSTAAGLR